MPWKVSDFRKISRAWGYHRRIIGEIRIGKTDAVIWLFRENDDGRQSISVHNRISGNSLIKLGFYWVDSDESKQKALDEIYETLMSLLNKKEEVKT